MERSPHITLAHRYWKEFLKPGMQIVDATLGNGKDTHLLAQCLVMGNIYGFDIQKEAIDKASAYLQENLEEPAYEMISFFHQSHQDLSFLKHPIDLIIYNLGYLPSGDKSITTEVRTTLESLKSALEILSENGMISITCYPGHLEGQKEQEAILEMLSNLPSHRYLICHHSWINRKAAPSLIILQKR